MSQKLWVVSWCLGPVRAYWTSKELSSQDPRSGYRKLRESAAEVFVKTALDMDLQTDLASPDVQG